MNPEQITENKVLELRELRETLKILNHQKLRGMLILNETEIAQERLRQEAVRVVTQAIILLYTPLRKLVQPTQNKP